MRTYTVICLIALFLVGCSNGPASSGSVVRGDTTEYADMPDGRTLSYGFIPSPPKTGQETLVAVVDQNGPNHAIFQGQVEYRIGSEDWKALTRLGESKGSTDGDGFARYEQRIELRPGATTLVLRLSGSELKEPYTTSPWSLNIK